MTLLTCSQCQHVIDAYPCPLCGHQPTRESLKHKDTAHRKPCDFCSHPWEQMWVDFPSQGVRFVCRGHGNPTLWDKIRTESGQLIPPYYRYDTTYLEHLAAEPHVRSYQPVT